MANQNWWQNGDTRGYENTNYYDDALPYNENYDYSGKGLAGSVGQFDYRNNWEKRRLPSNLTQDMGASTYQAPPVGNYQSTPFQPNQGNVAYAPEEKTGILESLKNKFSGITTPVMAMLKSQKNNPEEVFGLKNFPTYNGRVNYHPNDSLYAGMNVATGFGKGLSGAGQKRIDRIQNTVDNFADQWSNLATSDDPEDKAAYKRKLDFHQAKLAKFKAEQAAYQADLAAQTGQGGTEIIAPASDKGGTTYGGPPTKSWDPVQHAKSGGGHYRGHAATAGRPAAGPQSGSYGVWKRDGGRIGYQGGELVEDEYMAEATPAGMMEENIEEVQGEPTREQLEVIALEIFQLPLEQLSKPQLEIVYRAAMEQEPSEEEVQFAAQEGPGEGIASLV